MEVVRIISYDLIYIIYHAFTLLPQGQKSGVANVNRGTEKSIDLTVDSRQIQDGYFQFLIGRTDPVDSPIPHGVVHRMTAHDGVVPIGNVNGPIRSHHHVTGAKPFRRVPVHRRPT